MYANEYFKTSVHDFSGFFNGIEDEDNKILDLKKKITSLTKSLQEIQQEYTNALSCNYKDGFTPVPYNLIICYENRNWDKFYFDLYSGIHLEEDEVDDVNKYRIISVSKKCFNVQVVVGYIFSLGSVVVKEYSCRINGDNSKMSSTITNEFIVPMFEKGNDCYFKNGLAIKAFPSSLGKENASYFLSEFYGQKIKAPFSLEKAKNYFQLNPSFEIILKTCKFENCIIPLLELKVEKAEPIYQILKIKKEELEYLENNNLLRDYVEFNEYSKNLIKKGFIKTPKEKIELIEKFKEYEEDLEFYSISFTKPLLVQMLDCYYGLGWNTYKNFPSYYSFTDFARYVITETQNQGFTSVSGFTKTLADYFQMCEDMNFKPILYSSYIKQTHDITSRNYQIKLTKEQEELFDSKYKDFKTYIDKDYIVVAPKNADDVKEEGNVLNHCVASYIKKILSDKCRILFLRSKEDIESRLITVEVRDGMITEARGAHNRKLRNPEREALERFAKKRGLIMRT